MLNWSMQFSIFSFLDNCNYHLPPHRHEFLMALDPCQSFLSDGLKGLDDFAQAGKWYFGHLSYELKNGIYHFDASGKDPIGFPLLHFFEPRILLKYSNNILSIVAPEPDGVMESIMKQEPAPVLPSSAIHLASRLSKEDYLEKIKALQRHIQWGDCYEINFCQEFFALNAKTDPLKLFLDLSTASPNPFSAFYRFQHAYLICASPERFLMKENQKLISQPMKGTIRRNPADRSADQELMLELQSSPKERSENVMIVDLVRNDLTRVCEPTSVQVDELFGIQTFPQVHQMVSTISGELQPGRGYEQIFEALFPMGSMTGAPKYRVMQLIEEYETAARGIFSGSVGYIDPNGNFDFNVVIRSLMYNAATGYLSYQTGSGITCYSDPEKEWEECMLKGEAIRKILQ